MRTLRLRMVNTRFLPVANRVSLRIATRLKEALFSLRAMVISMSNGMRENSRHISVPMF